MVAAAGKATRLRPWNSPIEYTVMISNRRALPALAGDAGSAPPALAAAAARWDSLTLTVAGHRMRTPRCLGGTPGPGPPLDRASSTTGKSFG